MTALDRIVEMLPLFGVAALSWFLHPALMIAVTLGVLYVLHQREFWSQTLKALEGQG
jgi:uncharacterized membrane protein